MLIPPRRRDGSTRSNDARARSTRWAGSAVEALEGRQLLATAAPGPISQAQPALVATEATPTPSLAPRVSFVQFEPLTGRVLVAITGDFAGIGREALTNPANYTFEPTVASPTGPTIDPSRPSAGVVLIPNYVVTGVSLTPAQAPGQGQSLIVTINNNQPLRDGFYRFTIRAAGIVDGAGRALDGSYQGVFPSGNGHPGSNFVAVLAVVHNTVQPALPVKAGAVKVAPGSVKPTPVFFPTTQQVHIRIVGNNNRTSRTLGGGNAFVQPLLGQFYPGRFHLPETVGGHRIRPVHLPVRPGR